MQTVFVLQHSYERDFCDETKFIGVYLTNELAEAAIDRLKTQPGFKDRIEDFYISEYELNKDHWTEGFCAMTAIVVKDKNGNSMTVEAEQFVDGTYQIIENYRSEELGEFKNLDIVKCELIDDILYAKELVKRQNTN